MNRDRREKTSLENSSKVAKKMYDVSYYKSNEAIDQGMAITHEQVSDNYTEGTIDGKIDELNKEGALKTHDGEPLRRKGPE
ncbi:DUF4025 domain-containing protein [Virgibacillus kimchii]